MGLQGMGIKGFSGCSVRLLSQWIAIRSGRRWRRRGRNSGQARIQIWTTSNCVCTNGLRNIRTLLEGRKIAAHEVARLRREIQKSAFIIFQRSCPRSPQPTVIQEHWHILVSHALHCTGAYIVKECIHGPQGRQATRGYCRPPSVIFVCSRL